MSRPLKHLLFSLMKHIHSGGGSASSGAVLLSTGARCSPLMHSVCPRSMQRKVRLRRRALELALMLVSLLSAEGWMCTVEEPGAGNAEG